MGTQGKWLLTQHIYYIGYTHKHTSNNEVSKHLSLASVSTCLLAKQWLCNNDYQKTNVQVHSLAPGIHVFPTCVSMLLEHIKYKYS